MKYTDADAREGGAEGCTVKAAAGQRVVTVQTG